MEHLIFTSYIIFIASDTTAGLFLIILILSIAVQSEKRQELAHLLSASILILAGIFLLSDSDPACLPDAELLQAWI